MARLTWTILFQCMMIACGQEADSPVLPGAEPAALPRHVVLVTLDTTRPDRLGAYGGDPSVSPAFDGLARRGMLFTACDSASPLTLPSHATLLTGLEPPAHGLRSNGRGRLPATIPTLAEILSTKGWRTGAFVSSTVLDRRHGLDRGFDTYDDHVGPDGERRGEQTLDRALAWWLARRDAQTLLWLHLFDPHAPYRPPEPYARLYRDRPYEGEIAYTDAMLARLLAALDLDTTLILVVGDHGEGLGAHGEQEHGLLLHQATLAVPLVVAGPGITPGRELGAVRTVDVLPTLLGRLGLSLPLSGQPLASEASWRGTPGRDLLAAAPSSVGSGPGLPMAYAETLLPWEDYGWSPLVSFRRGSFKVVSGIYAEAFNVESDPEETHDLLGGGSASMPPEVPPLLAHARGFQPDPASLRIEAEQPEPIDGKFHLDRLRSLGYLSTSQRTPPGDPKLRDPRRQAGFHERVRSALAHYRDDEFEKAWSAIAHLLREQPSNPFLHDLAGSIAMARGRPEDAVAHYQEALRGIADRGAVESRLAEALLAAGQPVAAEATARGILARFSVENPPLRAAVVLCRSLVAQGRLAEASASAGFFLERTAAGEETPGNDPLVQDLRRLADGDVP